MGGEGVKVLVGGCLPYPAFLSAPVTLTLALSGRGMPLQNLGDWLSPSGPAPPLTLTPGPSPAERERGVDCSGWRF